MSSHNKIDVDDVIESLGFGWFQWKMLLICGMGWAADGMEMIAISFLLLELKTDPDWTLSEAELGMLGASTFVGMLVGAYFWGLVSDRVGRRFAFQATVMIVALSGMTSSFSPNLAFLLTCRILLGFGLGGNLPVDFAMFMEFTPVSKRGFFSTVLSAAWSVGEVFSCLLAYAFLDYSWRVYLFCNSMLGFFIFFVRRTIPESPRYLIVMNDHEGAWNSLRTVAESNKRELPPRESVHIPPSEKPLSVMYLLSPKLIKVSLLLWLIWLCSSTNLYGLFLFAPTYFSQKGVDNADIITDTLLTTLVEVPGILSAAYLVDTLGRKNTIVVGFFLSALTTFSFGATDTQTGMLLTLMIAKFFIYATSATIYTYTPEVYPTSLRTTGMGTASCMTRIAGIITPIVGESIVHADAFASVAIWAVAALVGCVAAVNLPFDTLSRKLVDTLEGEPPYSPRSRVQVEEEEESAPLIKD